MDDNCNCHKRQWIEYRDDCPSCSSEIHHIMDKRFEMAIHFIETHEELPSDDKMTLLWLATLTNSTDSIVTRQMAWDNIKSTFRNCPLFARKYNVFKQTEWGSVING